MTEKQQLEIERLTQWINDCQSGMYINCVYCGHRYGPEDKVKNTMQEALYEHIAKCKKHPLFKANQKIKELKHVLINIKEMINTELDEDYIPHNSLLYQVEEDIASILNEL